MTALPNLKDVLGLIKTAILQWLEDKAPRLGAALAYYTAFSLAPLLVIIIAIAGFFLGPDAAAGRLTGQIKGMVGEHGGEAVQTMVAAANKPTSGTVATGLGIVMLIFGALGLFGQLQDALNTVWDVEPKPGRGIWGFVRDRLLSFSMVLGTAFLLLVSLVISAALDAFGSLMGDWDATILGQAINIAVSLVVITLLFAMIYRFLPDAKVAWNDVWFGAAVTTVLFVVGKFAIGLYLGRAGTASAYGAAGSLAVLLIWLYYSAQIFLFGAEVTKAFAQRYGSRIVPKDNAVSINHDPQGENKVQRAFEPSH